MDPEHWQRAIELFERVVELPEAERDRFLSGACNGDPALLQQVRRLIVEDGRSDTHLEPPESGAISGALSDADSVEGGAIGPYRIEYRIGAGGMGSVYLASRADEHFEKRVALKLIKRGMDTDDILRRFKNERQVLAGLEHAGIARLLDGGATEDGRPYLVMEYVEGVPIDQYCDDRRLTVRARLELFRKVCEAVHFAHENQIIHRDLKPSNVLVTADGDPKLLDFGIAKVVDQAASAGTVDLTATELRLMTPEYASPEQVRGDQVTASSDVYSLGVLLYELLAGVRPYAVTTRLRSEYERVICEVDPVRPSLAAATGSSVDSRQTAVERGTTRSVDARTLRSQLAGDLDTIVLKVLRKEPQRRYRSVRELSEDLRRHLEGLPVSARPDTWRYRSAKFVRRNRALVITTASVFLALLAGFVVSLILYLQSESLRAAEETATANAKREAYLARISAGALAIRSADVVDARRHLEGAPAELRGWEWRHLWSRLDGSLRTLEGHGGVVRALAVSPDGGLLASVGEDGALSIWDLEDGGRVLRKRQHDGNLISVSLNHDGTRVAYVCERNYARIVDVATGETVFEWRDEPVLPRNVAFSPDGGQLATSGAKGRIVLHDTDTGGLQIELPPQGAPVRALAYAPTGDLLASGTLGMNGNELQNRGLATAVQGEGTVAHIRLWDPATGDLVGTLETTEPVVAVVFGPREERLYSLSTTGILQVWDVASLQLVDGWEAHGSAAFGLARTPSGHRLATVGKDGTARLWNAAGEQLALLLGHTSEVRCAAFASDTLLLTGSRDRTIRLWGQGSDDVRTLRDDPGWRGKAYVTPDGTRIACCAGRPGEPGAVTVLDVLTGEQVWTATEHRDAVYDLAIGPRGRRIVTGSKDMHVILWDAEDGTILWTAKEQERVWGVAFTPDGSQVASSTLGGTVRLWDAIDGSLQATLAISESGLTSVQFSPDGKHLVVGCHDHTARVWDIAAGSQIAVLEGHEQVVAQAIYAPDGRQIATASNDRTVRLWDAQEGRELAVLHGPPGTRGLTFSPDGRRLITGSEDAVLRVWDVDSGDELVALYGHDSSVCSVAFSPDGSWVVSKDVYGVIRIWETELTDPAAAGR